MTLQALLTKRVNIESFTVSVVAGARQKAWSTKYTALPCAIQPNTVYEVIDFEADSYRITHNVYLGSPGMSPITNLAITQGERVLFGTRYFQILGIRNPDEANRYLLLKCNELKS